MATVRPAPLMSRRRLTADAASSVVSDHAHAAAVLAQATVGIEGRGRGPGVVGQIVAGCGGVCRGGSAGVSATDAASPVAVHHPDASPVGTEPPVGVEFGFAHS